MDQFGRVGRIKGACPEPRRQLSHPQRFGFASPPATEQDLRRTEDALGYSLPAFLRALYTTIADGNFGPDCGLINTHYLAYQRRDEYVKIERAACPVNEESSVMFGLTCWSIPEGTWPNQFLYLINWGCGNVTYLDIPTGQIFYDLSEDAGFCLQAPSLEELLERWACDEFLKPVP